MSSTRPVDGSSHTAPLDLSSLRLALAGAGAAVRGYGTLLLAAAIPLGLAGSISILLALPIIGRAGAVTDGQLIPVGATGVDAVLVVRWTVYVLALVVALAAVVAIATGLLAGHPIRLHGGLGLVGRRLPRLLLLAGAVCPIPLAVAILKYGWWLIPPWTRLLALLLLLPLWALVGLPVALFEKRRISSWVGRLTVGPCALLVVALVASLAVLTLLAGAAAIGPLLLINEAALLTLLAVVPFAGSVISAVYLDRRHGERAGSDIAAARRWLATLPPCALRGTPAPRVTRGRGGAQQQARSGAGGRGARRPTPSALPVRG